MARRAPKRRTDAEPGLDRSPIAIADVRRTIVSHLLAVTVEWAGTIGILVYAFQVGGPHQTGFVSLFVLSSALIGGPLAAALLRRFRPSRVRSLGLVAQTIGWGLAATASQRGAPPLVAAIPVFGALVALGTLRTTGAVILPARVRTGRELTRASFWIAQCESATALLGPVAAGVALAAAGPATLLAACAAATSVAAILSARISVGAPRRSVAMRARAVGPRGDPVRSGRRATSSILGLIAARSAVLGALDVLMVVLSFDALDVGGGAVGLLTALAGVGALGAIAALPACARRARLAPLIAGSVALMVAACVAIGATQSLPIVIVALPLLGLGAALTNNLGRMLLQRAAETSVLGSLFARVDVVTGIGFLVGSALAQLLLRLVGLRGAFWGIAAAIGALLAWAGRAAWRADAATDLPVVEMAILRALPQFADLGPLAMDAVARQARTIAVVAGAAVIREGEPGEEFYAVVAGSFTVTRSADFVRRLGPGSGFGEVALLVGVARTASVQAETDGVLLAVDRIAFLSAVTQSESSVAAAWDEMRAMTFDPGPVEETVRRGATPASGG